MGKSKKRSRTKALYEAAAVAAAAKQKQQRRSQHHLLLASVAAASDSSEYDSDDGRIGKNNNNNNTTINTTTKTTTKTSPTTDDISITIRTLQYFTENVDLFSHAKEYKQVRGLLHPLITKRIQESYNKGIDYRIKVTHHLSNQRWSSALGALQGVQDYQQIPKQGTIQRWVRDVDLCSNGTIKMKLLSSILRLTNDTNTNTNTSNTNSTSTASTTNTNTSNNMAVSNNDSDKTVLNTTTTTATTMTATDTDTDTTTNNMNQHDPRVALLAAQKLYNNNATTTNKRNYDDDDEYENEDEDEDEDEVENEGGADNDHETGKKWILQNSTIVYREKASERTPPNHYDLLLHTTTESDDVLPLTKIPTTETAGTSTKSVYNNNNNRNIIKHCIPFLNGGGSGSSNSNAGGGVFVLENVFSSKECSRLIDAATQLGYQKDHPITLDQPTGIDSCEWFVNESIHSLLYNRVGQYLPKSMGGSSNGGSGGGAVDGNHNNQSQNQNTIFGLNRRWRFFRYGQGGVYRPHIDGSWPASHLTQKKVGGRRHNTNEQERDSDSDYQYETDITGTTRSYLTFLIYLNDTFDGGETKFYHPITTTTNSEATDSNSKNSHNMMMTMGVIPKRGSVLVFPQGNTASLLHEGSAVTRGTKYVIRTDVLYKNNNNVSGTNITGTGTGGK